MSNYLKALFLAVMLVLIGTAADTAVASHQFVDVPDSDTFHDDTSWLADQGITRGCNPPANTRFCPDDPVTRGQMAAFLNRALNLEASNTTFADTVGHTFEADIAALAGAGITRGCNPPANTLFCPNTPVSRGEMAAFLTRALSLNPSNAFFADAVENTFSRDISALADVGITRGCNPPANYNFCPDESVTRAQMAAFLRRALSGDLRSGEGQTISDAGLSYFLASEELCIAHADRFGNPRPDPARYDSVSVISILDAYRVLIRDGTDDRLIVDFSYRPPVIYLEEGPTAVLPYDLSFGCPSDLVLGSHWD